MYRMSKVHENDKISTQRRFNSTVSRETYKHGRHSFLTPRALLSRVHARANDMNYRGTVRTPTCNKNYSFSSEHLWSAPVTQFLFHLVGISDFQCVGSFPGFL